MVDEKEVPKSIPPLPASHIVREVLREARTLITLVIIGLLLRSHSLDPAIGVTAMLGILGFHLYPRPEQK